TCLRDKGDLRVAWAAVFSALPSGVLPLGLAKFRAQVSKAEESNGPNLTTSRAPGLLKMNSPASILRAAPEDALVAKARTCLAIAIRARFAMRYFGAGLPSLSGTASFMLPDVS